MSTLIPQVNDQPKETSAEFIRLTIKKAGEADDVYTFSSSYRNEVIDNLNYTPVGGLLEIGEQRRDIRATSFDTTFTLTGLDPDNIFLVLAEPIRGSEVEIYRGFYDSNYNLVNTVKRFTGIVTGYSISEQREQDIDIFSITINCSSYKTVLENNTGGRRTNSETWRKFYGTTDTSMDRIESLHEVSFNFGLKPT